MIEVQAIKDIANYKSKVVGPLTLRQTIAAAIACPTGWAIYYYLSPYLGTDLAGFFLIIPGVTAYLFGWVSPYGMPFEKFLKSIFTNTVLAPSHRKYKTSNRQEEAIAYFQPLLSYYQDAGLLPSDASAVKNKKHHKRYKVSDKSVL